MSLWHPVLFLNGEFVACPDLYLPEHGVAVEVDSMTFHATPDEREHTMRRHARMTAAGLVVLHVTPRRA